MILSFGSVVCGSWSGSRSSVELVEVNPKKKGKNKERSLCLKSLSNIEDNSAGNSVSEAMRYHYWYFRFGERERRFRFLVNCERYRHGSSNGDYKGNNGVPTGKLEACGKIWNKRNAHK